MLWARRCAVTEWNGDPFVMSHFLLAFVDLHKGSSAVLHSGRIRVWLKHTSNSATAFGINAVIALKKALSHCVHFQR